MRRALPIILALILVSFPASGEVKPFPTGFKAEMIAINDAKIYVRKGGNGPAVIMIHGFGDTGDMWEPLATVMMGNHTVIVPDLRGMGLSVFCRAWL